MRLPQNLLRNMKIMQLKNQKIILPDFLQSHLVEEDMLLSVLVQVTSVARVPMVLVEVTMALVAGEDL